MKLTRDDSCLKIIKIERINTRILEIQNEKENKKTHRRKKLNNKKNYSHILSYYKSELTVLESEKEKIHKLQSDRVISISVPWNYIEFGEGEIIVKLDATGQFLQVNNPLAKGSFNKILVLFSDRIDPLQLAIDGFGDASIINNQVFLEVLEFLSIKENLMSAGYIPMTDILKLSNTINRLFLPKEKTEYLEWLSENQGESYKVIPIIETKKYGGCIQFEDGFLFTIKTNRLLVIWENVNINRATYVFSPNNENAEIVCQKIYDFSASGIEFKRSRMRQSDEVLRHLLNCDYYILLHTDFIKWKNKLLSI